MTKGFLIKAFVCFGFILLFLLVTFYPTGTSGNIEKELIHVKIMDRTKTDSELVHVVTKDSSKWVKTDPIYSIFIDVNGVTKRIDSKKYYNAYDIGEEIYVYVVSHYSRNKNLLSIEYIPKDFY